MSPGCGQGKGRRDERRRSNTSEVGTDNGTVEKNEEKKRKNDGVDDANNNNNNNKADSRNGRHGGGVALRADLPPEQGPEGVSVARAHGVVDHDVEGGVDVGKDVEEPQTHREQVVMTSSCVHFRHEGQQEPAW